MTYKRRRIYTTEEERKKYAIEIRRYGFPEDVIYGNVINAAKALPNFLRTFSFIGQNPCLSIEWYNEARWIWSYKSQCEGCHESGYGLLSAYFDGTMRERGHYYVCNCDSYTYC